jgi:hypothetical protein
MKEFTFKSPIPAGGRNHTDAPCPQCGGQLADRSAGNVPGEVACNACDWHGEWMRTLNPQDMETGGAVAYFSQPHNKNL